MTMGDMDQVREYHRRALESDRAGERFRDQRDLLARAAWEDWNGTIGSFAKELGISHELASKIIHARRRLSQMTQCQ